MKEKRSEGSYSSLNGFHRAIPIIMIALAVFVGLCFILQDVGIFGKATGGVMLGLFSYGAYAVPVLLLIQALFYPSDLAKKRLLTRFLFSTLTVICISALAYAITYWGNKEVVFSVSDFYSNGQNHVGGGFVGGVIGFGITKLIGSVGMVILAALVFALYLTYFFSGGQNLLLIILRGIVGFFASIETKIKARSAKSKQMRAEKRNRRSEKKNAVLTEDDFFAVDNGMQSLSINDLGISESRKEEEFEENLTLHEKVHRKSESCDFSSQNFSGDYEFTSAEDEYRAAEETVRKTIIINSESLDSELKHFVTDEEPRTDDIMVEETGYAAQQIFNRSDDSAESVFTQDFDPFNFAIADKLSKKPSSKAADAAASPTTEFSTITEDLSDITEEELERRRRNEAFERRKEQLKAMRRAEEERIAPAETPEKTVTFNTDVHTASLETLEDEPTLSVKIDKPECDPSAKERCGSGIYKQEYTINTNRPEPVAVAADHARNTYRRAAEFAVATDSSLNTSASRVPYKSAEDVMYNDAYTKEAQRTSEPELVTPVTEKSATEGGGLVFEFEEAKEEKRSITVERSRISPTEWIDPNASHDETEDDYTDEDNSIIGAEMEDSPVYEQTRTQSPIGFNATDRCEMSSLEAAEAAEAEDYPDDDTLSQGMSEDAPEEDYEIPEEEQNPDVVGYRDMFAMFREEAGNTEDEDEETEPVQSETAEEDAPYTPKEDEDDLDEPPFENATTAIPSNISDIVKKEKRSEPEKKKLDFKNYKKPPLDLLGLDEAQDDEQMLAEINENSNILIETLQSFNVTASIRGVDKGPRITRYEVVPAKGVKVNAITHLFQDIELNLAAEGIRMEAPIPGKSAIGFEIPNKHPANVRLRELLETDEFQNAKSTTFVCIGKDVAGNPIFGDIAKYPHALVAGATGMGKSVCINSIMISVLYKARPDEVKFIMIDPKKVEFKMYSGIPHLLIPVITEAKQAAGALMWAVEEMERRYDLIEQNFVRNIDAYNEKARKDPSVGDPLPKIIIVIDELNDLMMQVRDPVEDLIMRIAQKARAAGIHLIIGTQRPSVNVITGTIKANINTRISCKVSSQVDSRTILEMAGAEKLLNRGDMLYMPVDRPKPIRVQGAFVSDPEVEAIMDFLKTQSDGAQYDDEVFAEINRAAQKCNKKSGGSAADDVDEEDDQAGFYNDQQFLDGVELAIRSGKVSTALLQRKLSIGYGKAARYIDAMVDIGIVSEPNGQKPRDVLITMDEWHEKLSRVNLDD